MHLHPRAALLALLSTAWLAVATARPATPSHAASGISAYRSAFEGYRRFEDQPVAPWKETNATVAQIGGWNAYASQAAADDAGPAPEPPAAALAPQPATPAGHEGHHHQKKP